jgi:gliding motility-associated-like protein
MTDTVIVKKDCYVDVPNIFTPNGDGVNDYFFPRRLLSKSLATFGMHIYNRWGQLVYETKNIDGQGWDGALNGVQQPGGVYVYLIEATFEDGQIEQHSGNVTILR